MARKLRSLLVEMKRGRRIIRVSRSRLIFYRVIGKKGKRNVFKRRGLTRFALGFTVSYKKTNLALDIRAVVVCRPERLAAIRRAMIKATQERFATKKMKKMDAKKFLLELPGPDSPHVLGVEVVGENAKGNARVEKTSYVIKDKGNRTAAEALRTDLDEALAPPRRKPILKKSK